MNNYYLKTVKHAFTALLIMVSISAFAQPFNDVCQAAFNIPSVNNYCSLPLEFTNVGATADPGLPLEGTAQGCFINHTNGVWFTFRPFESAVRINVFTGLDDNLGFDIKLTLFEGSCNNLTFFDCSPGAISDVEYLVNGLTLGQRYFLLVESENIESAFQLCIDEFFSPPDPQADCPEAVVLCDMSGFSVGNLSDVGDIIDEMTGPCVDENAGQQFEQASTWYTWVADESGTLTFTITPTNPIDPQEDLDFVLYRLPGGLGDCDNREAIRCMLSGEQGTNDPNTNLSLPCFGPTGLREGETDVNEFAGCSPGDNNFLAPVDMVSGEAYALIVNNFSRSGFGFDIEFGGTGSFLGPQLDFAFETLGNVIECDKLVEFRDNSISTTDPITSIAWNFGEGAFPPRESGPGPLLVEYESFGNKLINLIVETTRGCIVNETFEVFVESCCEDLPQDLEIAVQSTDVLCAGEETGEILANGVAGNPDFLFSINGGDLSPNTIFNQLPAGQFSIQVTDIKGCTADTVITIEEPDPILVDAGFDIEVDLGFSDTLNVSLMAGIGDVTYTWIPEEGLECPGSVNVDCPNPIVTSPGTTTYTVIVTDENGCTAEDRVTVVTNIVRPVFQPNVITPDSQDDNSIFVLGFGRQVERVLTFNIYDRWGGLIYTDADIGITADNLMERGWNGRFGAGLGTSSTRQVNPGVFAWYAEVLFIDGVVQAIAGDVTVIK